MTQRRDVPVPVDRWQVPPVVLNEDRTKILWPADFMARPPPWHLWPPRPERAGRPPDTVTLLLNDNAPFTRLLRLGSLDSDDPSFPDEVLDLAGAVGPLGLCERHGRPHFTHVETQRIDSSPVEPLEVQIECLPEMHPPVPPMRTDCYAEPVSRWHELAVQAQTALRIADRLRRNRPDTPVEDWSILDVSYHMNPPDLDPDFHLDPDGPGPGDTFIGVTDSGTVLFDRRMDSDDLLLHQKAALAAHVEQWLHDGDVSVHFDWVEPLPTIVLGSANLFGYLAVELAMHVWGRRGIAICWYCKRAFEPLNAPKPDQRYSCQRPQCEARKKADEESRRRARRKKDRRT